jgi:hypothetical protein
MNYWPALLGSGEYHFMGVNVMPRAFIGRIISPFLKRKVLGEQPIAKNSFTDKSHIFPDNLRLIARKRETALWEMRFRASWFPHIGTIPGASATIETLPHKLQLH